MDPIEALLCSNLNDEESNLLSNKIIKDNNLNLSSEQVLESFKTFAKYLNRNKSKIKYYHFILGEALSKHKDLFTAIILAPKMKYFLNNLHYLMVPEFQYHPYPPDPAYIRLDNRDAHGVAMFLMAVHKIDLTDLVKYYDTKEIFEFTTNLRSGLNTKAAK
jgi:hypothetical protein